MKKKTLCFFKAIFEKKNVGLKTLNLSVKKKVGKEKFMAFFLCQNILKKNFFFMLNFLVNLQDFNIFFLSLIINFNFQILLKNFLKNNFK